ncbi:unnamed protein product, partial [Amoebophrya sp. A120]|eukprot:GSA120T00022623001.1
MNEDEEDQIQKLQDGLRHEEHFEQNLLLDSGNPNVIRGFGSSSSLDPDLQGQNFTSSAASERKSKKEKRRDSSSEATVGAKKSKKQKKVEDRMNYGTSMRSTSAPANPIAADFVLHDNEKVKAEPRRSMVTGLKRRSEDDLVDARTGRQQAEAEGAPAPELVTLERLATTPTERVHEGEHQSSTANASSRGGKNKVSLVSSKRRKSEPKNEGEEQMVFESGHSITDGGDELSQSLSHLPEPSKKNADEERKMQSKKISEDTSAATARQKRWEENRSRSFKKKDKKKEKKKKEEITPSPSGTSEGSSGPSSIASGDSEPGVDNSNSSLEPQNKKKKKEKKEKKEVKMAAFEEAREHYFDKRAGREPKGNLRHRPKERKLLHPHNTMESLELEPLEYYDSSGENNSGTTGKNKLLQPKSAAQIYPDSQTDEIEESYPKRADPSALEPGSVGSSEQGTMAAEEREEKKRMINEAMQSKFGRDFYDSAKSMQTTKKAKETTHDDVRPSRGEDVDEDINMTIAPGLGGPPAPPLSAAQQAEVEKSQYASATSFASAEQEDALQLAGSSKYEDALENDNADPRTKTLKSKKKKKVWVPYEDAKSVESFRVRRNEDMEGVRTKPAMTKQVSKEKKTPLEVSHPERQKYVQAQEEEREKRRARPVSEKEKPKKGKEKKKDAAQELGSWDKQYADAQSKVYAEVAQMSRKHVEAKGRELREEKSVPAVAKSGIKAVTDTAQSQKYADAQSNKYDELQSVQQEEDAQRRTRQSSTGDLYQDGKEIKSRENRRTEYVDARENASEEDEQNVEDAGSSPSVSASSPSSPGPDRRQRKSSHEAARKRKSREPPRKSSKEPAHPRRKSREPPVLLPPEIAPAGEQHSSSSSSEEEENEDEQNFSPSQDQELHQITQQELQLAKQNEELKKQLAQTQKEMQEDLDHLQKALAAEDKITEKEHQMELDDVKELSQKALKTAQQAQREYDKSIEVDGADPTSKMKQVLKLGKNILIEHADGAEVTQLEDQFYFQQPIGFQHFPFGTMQELVPGVGVSSKNKMLYKNRGRPRARTRPPGGNYPKQQQRNMQQVDLPPMINFSSASHSPTSQRQFIFGAPDSRPMSSSASPASYSTRGRGRGRNAAGQQQQQVLPHEQHPIRHHATHWHHGLREDNRLPHEQEYDDEKPAWIPPGPGKNHAVSTSPRSSPGAASSPKMMKTRKGKPPVKSPRGGPAFQDSGVVTPRNVGNLMSPSTGFLLPATVDIFHNFGSPGRFVYKNGKPHFLQTKKRSFSAPATGNAKKVGEAGRGRPRSRSGSPSLQQLPGQNEDPPMLNLSDFEQAKALRGQRLQTQGSFLPFTPGSRSPQKLGTSTTGPPLLTPGEVATPMQHSRSRQPVYSGGRGVPTLFDFSRNWHGKLAQLHVPGIDFHAVAQNARGVVGRDKNRQTTATPRSRSASVQLPGVLSSVDNLRAKKKHRQDAFREQQTEHLNALREVRLQARSGHLSQEGARFLTQKLMAKHDKEVILLRRELDVLDTKIIEQMQPKKQVALSTMLAHDVDFLPTSEEKSAQVLAALHLGLATQAQDFDCGFVDVPESLVVETAAADIIGADDDKDTGATGTAQITNRRNNKSTLDEKPVIIDLRKQREEQEKLAKIKEVERLEQERLDNLEKEKKMLEEEQESIRKQEMENKRLMNLMRDLPEEHKELVLDYLNSRKKLQKARDGVAHIVQNKEANRLFQVLSMVKKEQRKLTEEFDQIAPVAKEVVRLALAQDRWEELQNDPDTGELIADFDNRLQHKAQELEEVKQILDELYEQNELVEKETSVVKQELAEKEKQFETETGAVQFDPVTHHLEIQKLKEALKPWASEMQRLESGIAEASGVKERLELEMLLIVNPNPPTSPGVAEDDGDVGEQEADPMQTINYQIAEAFRNMVDAGKLSPEDLESAQRNAQFLLQDKQDLEKRIEVVSAKREELRQQMLEIGVTEKTFAKGIVALQSSANAMRRAREALVQNGLRAEDYLPKKEEAVESGAHHRDSEMKEKALRGETGVDVDAATGAGAEEAVIKAGERSSGAAAISKRVSSRAARRSIFVPKNAEPLLVRGTYLKPATREDAKHKNAVAAPGTGIAGRGDPGTAEQMTTFYIEREPLFEITGLSGLHGLLPNSGPPWKYKVWEVAKAPARGETAKFKPGITVAGAARTSPIRSRSVSPTAGAPSSPGAGGGARGGTRSPPGKNVIGASIFYPPRRNKQHEKFVRKDEQYQHEESEHWRGQLRNSQNSSKLFSSAKMFSSSSPKPSRAKTDSQVEVVRGSSLRRDEQEERQGDEGARRSATAAAAAAKKQVSITSSERQRRLIKTSANEDITVDIPPPEGWEKMRMTVSPPRALQVSSDTSERVEIAGAAAAPKSSSQPVATPKDFGLEESYLSEDGFGSNLTPEEKKEKRLLASAKRHLQRKKTQDPERFGEVDIRDGPNDNFPVIKPARPQSDKIKELLSKFEASPEGEQYDMNASLRGDSLGSSPSAVLAEKLRSSMGGGDKDKDSAGRGKSPSSFHNSVHRKSIEEVMAKTAKLSQDRAASRSLSPTPILGQHHASQEKWRRSIDSGKWRSQSSQQQSSFGAPGSFGQYNYPRSVASGTGSEAYKNSSLDFRGSGSVQRSNKSSGNFEGSRAADSTSSLAKLPVTDAGHYVKEEADNSADGVPKWVQKERDEHSVLQRNHESIERLTRQSSREPRDSSTTTPGLQGQKQSPAAEGPAVVAQPLPPGPGRSTPPPVSGLSDPEKEQSQSFEQTGSISIGGGPRAEGSAKASSASSPVVPEQSGHDDVLDEGESSAVYLEPTDSDVHQEVETGSAKTSAGAAPAGASTGIAKSAPEDAAPAARSADLAKTERAKSPEDGHYTLDQTASSSSSSSGSGSSSSSSGSDSASKSSSNLNNRKAGDHENKLYYPSPEHSSSEPTVSKVSSRVDDTALGAHGVDVRAGEKNPEAAAIASCEERNAAQIKQSRDKNNFSFFPENPPEGGATDSRQQRSPGKNVAGENVSNQSSRSQSWLKRVLKGPPGGTSVKSPRGGQLQHAQQEGEAMEVVPRHPNPILQHQYHIPPYAMLFHGKMQMARRQAKREQVKSPLLVDTTKNLDEMHEKATGMKIQETSTRDEDQSPGWRQRLANKFDGRKPTEADAARRADPNHKYSMTVANREFVFGKDGHGFKPKSQDSEGGSAGERRTRIPRSRVDPEGLKSQITDASNKASRLEEEAEADPIEIERSEEEAEGEDEGQNVKWQKDRKSGKWIPALPGDIFPQEDLDSNTFADGSQREFRGFSLGSTSRNSKEGVVVTLAKSGPVGSVHLVTSDTSLDPRRDSQGEVVAEGTTGKNASSSLRGSAAEQAGLLQDVMPQKNTAIRFTNQYSENGDDGIVDEEDEENNENSAQTAIENQLVPDTSAFEDENQDDDTPANAPRGRTSALGDEVVKRSSRWKEASTKRPTIPDPAADELRRGSAADKDRPPGAPTGGDRLSNSRKSSVSETRNSMRREEIKQGIQNVLRASSKGGDAKALFRDLRSSYIYKGGNDVEEKVMNSEYEFQPEDEASQQSGGASSNGLLENRTTMQPASGKSKVKSKGLSPESSSAQEFASHPPVVIRATRASSLRDNFLSSELETRPDSVKTSLHEEHFHWFVGNQERKKQKSPYAYHPQTKKMHQYDEFYRHSGGHILHQEAGYYYHKNVGDSGVLFSPRRGRSPPPKSDNSVLSKDNWSRAHETFYDGGKEHQNQPWNKSTNVYGSLHKFSRGKNSPKTFAPDYVVAKVEKNLEEERETAMLREQMKSMMLKSTSGKDDINEAGFLGRDSAAKSTTEGALGSVGNDVQHNADGNVEFEKQRTAKGTKGNAATTKAVNIKAPSNKTPIISPLNDKNFTFIPPQRTEKDNPVLENPPRLTKRNVKTGIGFTGGIDIHHSPASSKRTASPPDKEKVVSASPPHTFSGLPVLRAKKKKPQLQARSSMKFQDFDHNLRKQVSTPLTDEKLRRIAASLPTTPINKPKLKRGKSPARPVAVQTDYSMSPRSVMMRTQWENLGGMDLPPEKVLPFDRTASMFIGARMMEAMKHYNAGGEDGSSRPTEIYTSQRFLKGAAGPSPTHIAPAAFGRMSQKPLEGRKIIERSENDEVEKVQELARITMLEKALLEKGEKDREAARLTSPLSSGLQQQPTSFADQVRKDKNAGGELQENEKAKKPPKIKTVLAPSHGRTSGVSALDDFLSDTSERSFGKKRTPRKKHVKAPAHGRPTGVDPFAVLAGVPSSGGGGEGEAAEHE